MHFEPEEAAGAPEEAASSSSDLWFIVWFILWFILWFMFMVYFMVYFMLYLMVDVMVCFMVDLFCGAPEEAASSSLASSCEPEEAASSSSLEINRCFIGDMELHWWLERIWLRINSMYILLYILYMLCTK